MNAFARNKPKATELPPGDAPADTYQNSRNLQDSRLKDSERNAKQWRRNGLISHGLVVVLLGWNIYQGNGNRYVPYLIREDRYSNVLPPGSQPTLAGPMTDEEMAAAARSFIRNIRTRYADVAAMRANIIDAYNHTISGSPAATRMDTMFRTKDAFEQVKRELVSVENDHAAAVNVDPNGAPHQSYTYRVEWVERVTPRDGSSIPPPANKVAVVTLQVRPPSSEEVKEKNPRGIYTYEFTGWDQ